MPLDKKKEMKKETDALDKLFKDAGKHLDKLKNVAKGDLMFMSMVKMLDMSMKQSSKELKQMLKMVG